MWINKKRLTNLCNEVYAKGVTSGYRLGYLQGQIEKSNKGYILGARVTEQVEQILKEKE